VSEPTTAEDRRVWRIPPAGPALTLLVVTGLAALNIYGHPTTAVRAFTIGLGLIGLGTAITSLRLFLVVDHEGVAVRHLTKESWLPWDDIQRVEVVTGTRVFAGATTANTIRVVRNDGSYVDVPPSLVQPSKPTNKRQALARLERIVHEIEGFRVA
jgi:hypothetical protein